MEASRFGESVVYAKQHALSGIPAKFELRYARLSLGGSGMAALSGLASVFSFLFGGLGLAMVIGAVYLVLRRERFIAAATRTMAKVVAYETRDSTDADDGTTTTFHHPVLEFIDMQSRPHRLTSTLGTTSQSYPIGATVKFLYDPANPDKGEIDSISRLWGFYIGLACVGLFFMFIATKLHR
jgi:hypothetical protein